MKIRTRKPQVKFCMAVVVASIMLLGMFTHARADAVTDWNALAVTRTSASGKGPPQITRVLAMTHLAIHDSLNSIERRYEPYAFCAQVAQATSPEAAVAAAAYHVLVNENPTQSVNLDADYATALAAIPNGAPKTNGINLGRAAAFAIIAIRSGDFSAEAVAMTYTIPVPAPAGYWLPIGGQTPFGVGWGRVMPFAMRRGDQFRPRSPRGLILTGDLYTQEYNEVKTIGCSTCPYPDLHNIARFWAPNVINLWNRVARGVSASENLDLWDNGRLFALLAVSHADTAISVWDAKYHYNFWRPQTAIQLAATDGNPNTDPVPGWTSAIGNPAYPDFSSGHSGLDGAFAETMQRFFGFNQYAFTETNGGITRSFTSFSQAAKEGADSRVYGGIHFRSACSAALSQGEQVARLVSSKFLRKVGGDDDDDDDRTPVLDEK